MHNFWGVFRLFRAANLFCFFTVLCPLRAYLINLIVLDHDQLEHFIIKPTNHENDLGDESEMEETGESTRNIYDEEVEWLLLLSVYIFCWKSLWFLWFALIFCFHYLLVFFPVHLFLICSYWLRIAKINSVNFTTNGEFAKINSAKFAIFGAVNCENKFQENLCMRKFVPAKMCASKSFVINTK